MSLHLNTLVRITCALVCLLLGQGNQSLAAGEPEAVKTKPLQVNPAILSVIFSGSEVLHYAVSWSGGIKIGDIYMKIQRKKEKGKDDAFNISAKVKDYGAMSLIYPVDDTFNCFVSGPEKLPYLYQVHQKEGFGREITRRTEYDQINRLIRYQKNKEGEQQFNVTSQVYNEFASFIITRALLLNEKAPIMVPTFVDKKRQEVQVSLVKRERRKTMFGKKNTLKVQPKMHFKGLYEKSGTTTLWLTDDRCRVPVEIQSQIVIGSLVAELVAYSNAACPELVRAKGR